MASSDVNFNDCPIGVKNSANIKHLSETVDLRLDALMNRIEEKLDSMDNKIDIEFTQLNNRLDRIDSKVEKLDEKLKGVDSLDKFVEEKIANNTKDKIYNLARWIVVVLLGGSAVTLLGKVITDLVTK